MLDNLCFNCFKDRNNYEVCPHCGYVNGTLPEQEFHLYPGTVLNGRYLIGTVLGFGGFGITYKAWDVKLGSIVAIKEFYPGGLVNRVPGESMVQIFDGTEQTNYKEYLERFLDEAKNLAQFNGKANIVNVFGFFEENNTAYIVMEYLDGISLKDYVEQNGKMPIDTSLVIINDLLTGVGEVHKKGILHRDIAPDNVILTNEGVVKILDFGSARFSSDNNEKTLSAFIKPGYAAPEQYAAQGEQGVWTDIYGLGATMYYMVTGIKPEESTDRLVNDTVQRPSDLGVDIPLEVDKSIMKAMALQKEFRFKTTEEFLAAVLGEYEIEYPDVELKKRKRRRNILAALSGGVFVAAIALTIFIYNIMKVAPYTLIEPCEITMWVYVEPVEYDPGKSDMPESFKEKLQEDNSKQYEKKKLAYENLAENFEEYMKEKYKGREVNVNLWVFDSQEGYDISLKKAYDEDALPDIFMISDMYNQVSDKCMDLTEISQVLDNSDCNFISSSNYAELYPDKKLIPLGYNAPVIYVNESLVSDYNIDDVKTEFKSVDELIYLDKFANQNLITSASKGKTVESKVWGIDESAFGEFVALYSDSLTNSDSTININDENSNLITSLKDSYTNNNFNNKILMSDYFYFNQLAYLVGDTSIFENVNNYLGGSFEVIPLSNDGEHIVTLDTEIALSSKIDENKALASKAFVEYLLSKDGQTFINVVVGESLPINSDVMGDYTSSINEKFDILSDYENGKAIGESSIADKKTSIDIYNKCYIGDEAIDENISLNTEPTSAND